MQYKRQRTRNQRRSELRKTALMAVAFLIAWVMLGAMAIKVWAEHPAEQHVSGSEYITSDQADIHIRETDEVEEVIEEVAQADPEKVYFDVPLSEELQDFIAIECEVHHIDPAVVVAMIDRESDFQADAIGDSGEAFGLLQVQPRWHQERMDKLGVTDLLDPQQNVAVAVDYLAELIDRDNGLEWALMAYNAGATGASKGFGSDYAAEVLENSENLKGIDYFF